MRNLFYFILFILFSCTNTKIENNSQIIDNVNIIVDNWHKAASEADFDNYFLKMDSISIFIGTDASENWNKKQFEDFSRPFFEKGKAWDFKVLERNVYTSKNKDVVWFDELLKTWMGTCRGSGVLEEDDESWKIKHYVLSVTIPNDDIQKVIAATKVRDSIFQSKFFK